MEWIFGIISGVLQVGGYLYYAKKAQTGEIEPNPTSWIMWGYGTTLIFALELDSGASAAMLILPAACALSSIAVGFICWQRGKLRLPRERWEKTALGTDLALTAAYVASWILLGTALLTDAQKHGTDIAILIIGNLSVFVTFIPMLINTWREPRLEDPLPWTIWTAAYFSLAAATVSSNDWTWYLIMYPIECLILHAAVALLSKRHVLAHKIRFASGA